MEVCTFFNTFPCIFLFILVVFSKYVVRKTADVCVFYKNLTTAKWLFLKCLKFIEENKNDFRIRKIKWLPVSGAFHTSLMQPAVEPFQAALSMTRVTDPRIPVYSNIEGVIYQNANTIRANLSKQVSKNILFELKMTSCWFLQYIFAS